MIDAKTIEELRGLLAKATPGPWSTHLVDDTTIISPTREVATTCDSVQAEREDGYNIEYEQMEADAALIVAMRSALPALLDVTERASRAREDALREAAGVCEAYSEWASQKIQEGRGEIFGTVGNTADDCAARIRALTAENEALRREKGNIATIAKDLADRGYSGDAIAAAIRSGK